MTEHGRVVMNGLDDHPRDGGLAKIKRPAAAFVQEAIHRGEGFSGVE